MATPEEMDRVVRRAKQLRVRVWRVKQALEFLTADHAIFMRPKPEGSKASSQKDESIQKEILDHLNRFYYQSGCRLPRLDKARPYERILQLAQALKDGTDVLVLRVDNEMMPPETKPLIRDMKKFLDSILSRPENPLSEGSDLSDLSDDDMSGGSIISQYSG